MLRLSVLACLFAACYAGVALPQLPVLRTHQPVLGRIVGGEATTIDQVPHQIALLYFSSLLCGGSVIRADVVVSACHCVISSSASAFSVRAGSSNHNSGGTVASVSRVVEHEDYDDFDIDNDISLFFLSSSLPLGGNIAVIALARQTPAAGSTATTSGWGTTSEGGSVAAVIRKVDIPIVAHAQCVSAYASLGWLVSPQMICAGLPEGGKDACQGDSGGPLTVGGSLVGITSWGYGCARAGFPGVWADVAVLSSWVDNNLN